MLSGLYTKRKYINENIKKNKNMINDSDLNILFKKSTLNLHSYILWEVCRDNCNQYTKDNI
jgi:hypothetical protein